jgi:2-phospho-L-lactate guanylyltransferase
MATLRVRAVIPMKPLMQCKLRLARALDITRRARLALAMLEVVAGAARDADGISEVIVLGGDTVIQVLCRRLGVAWQEDRAGNLNAALQTIYEANRSPALDGMLYLAGDLPALEPHDVDDLLGAFAGHDLVLGAGARGGTNAILLRPNLPFNFELGERSLTRHQMQAGTLGLRWRVYDAAAVYADLDTPDDLARLRREDEARWRALMGSEEPAGSGAS